MHSCVNCLEWDERGTRLASGSDDCCLIIWDPFEHKHVIAMNTGHVGNIFSVKFMPNLNEYILVTGAADAKIRVHDISRMETRHVFACHTSRVKRLATTPSEPFLFWSASEDGTVRQFDLRETNQVDINKIIKCLVPLKQSNGLIQVTIISGSLSSEPNRTYVSQSPGQGFHTLVPDLSFDYSSPFSDHSLPRETFLAVATYLVMCAAHAPNIVINGGRLLVPINDSDYLELCA
ncbi:unnamed protein product [Echinostoma caproni]|uniref:Uncharacterized protein n=1 Tax=Echinostoma caproni TaxID=27848 RepID=A0A3P8LE36_9TREM|nr:unnamed protein product [Echinostoma caproni]